MMARRMMGKLPGSNALGVGDIQGSSLSATGMALSCCLMTRESCTPGIGACCTQGGVKRCTLSLRRLLDIAGCWVRD